MADEQGQGKDPKAGKEPFVPKEDRPEVRIKPDSPIGELRVRDLAAILGAVIGGGGGKTPFEVGKTDLKDFFDKDFPEVAKDFLKEVKSEKFEKPEIKEVKEIKDKPEKFEKREKLEKPENKELKFEKFEHGEVPVATERPGPDPRIDQLIAAVSGLTRHVGALANQVEELKKKVK
jgi:hypothetical protein